MENPFETILRKLEEVSEKQDRFMESTLNKGGLDRDDYLTVQATAEYLGLKVSTIHKYTRERKLRHYKRGASIYFKRTELNEYISCGLVQEAKKTARRV